MVSSRRLSALVALTVTCFGSKAYAEVNLPDLAARDGSLVLARTVDILDGGDVAPSPNDQNRPEAQKIVVLERIDSFVGSVPARFRVVVPKSEVDLSDLLLNPRAASGGYSGRPPADGLQKSDVTLWAVTPIDKSPKSDFVPAEGCIENLGVPKGVAYDKALPPVYRYADLLVRTALEGASFGHGIERMRAMQRLQGITSAFSPSADNAPVVPVRPLLAWLTQSAVDRWPSANEKDRLNLLSLRLFWQDPTAEVDFISLYRKIGRKGLIASLPPVTSEAFYVEECESDDIQDANAGFEHMRGSKNKSARVLIAADRWMQLGERGRSDRRFGEARGAGVFGSVLWYLTDTFGDRSLIENWSQPGPKEFQRARSAIRKYEGSAPR